MMHVAVRDAVDQAAAVERLRLVERHTFDAATVEEMTAGCALLDVVENDLVVGAVSVEVVGDNATIKAAVRTCGTPAHTYLELQLLEQLLARNGVRGVGLFTRRRALVRQLERRGWRTVSVEACARGIAFELRKDISHGR